MSTIFWIILDLIPGFEVEFKLGLQSLNENIIFENCDLMLNEKLWNEYFESERKKLPSNDETRKYIKKINLFQALSYLNFSTDGRFTNKTTDKLVMNNELSDTKEYFPARAPFLVAIFETLSNITAQTCGGVILNKRWVLTASSCVYMLPYVYRNGPFIAKSYHTVIANSTNPLYDGSVHNVSNIIFHPDKEKPLALLRIRPGLTVEPLKLYNSLFVHNLDAVVYGWSIFKNHNGNDVMELATIQSKTASLGDCNAGKIFKETHSVMCLIDKNKGNMVQINSGGAVLVLRHHQVYLLGVALVDRISFVITINSDNKWIKYTLKQ